MLENIFVRLLIKFGSIHFSNTLQFSFAKSFQFCSCTRKDDNFILVHENITALTAANNSSLTLGTFAQAKMWQSNYPITLVRRLWRYVALAF